MKNIITRIFFKQCASLLPCRQNAFFSTHSSPERLRAAMQHGKRKPLNKDDVQEVLKCSSFKIGKSLFLHVHQMDTVKNKSLLFDFLKKPPVSFKPSDAEETRDKLGFHVIKASFQNSVQWHILKGGRCSTRSFHEADFYYDLSLQIKKATSIDALKKIYYALKKSRYSPRYPLLEFLLCEQMNEDIHIALTSLCFTEFTFLSPYSRYLSINQDEFQVLRSVLLQLTTTLIANPHVLTRLPEYAPRDLQRPILSARNEIDLVKALYHENTLRHIKFMDWLIIRELLLHQRDFFSDPSRPIEQWYRLLDESQLPDIAFDFDSPFIKRYVETEYYLMRTRLSQNEPKQVYSSALYTLYQTAHPTKEQIAARVQLKLKEALREGNYQQTCYQWISRIQEVAQVAELTLSS